MSVCFFIQGVGTTDRVTCISVAWPHHGLPELRYPTDVHKTSYMHCHISHIRLTMDVLIKVGFQATGGTRCWDSALHSNIREAPVFLESRRRDVPMFYARVFCWCPTKRSLSCSTPRHSLIKLKGKHSVKRLHKFACHF